MIVGGDGALAARVKDATVNTVISFTVPFLASLPAEALGASGLVAAVVAAIAMQATRYGARRPGLDGTRAFVTAIGLTFGAVK